MRRFSRKHREVYTVDSNSMICSISEDYLKESLTNRFWFRINKTDTCWIWNGGRNDKGYGRIAICTVMTVAHRVSWIIHHGSIPDGLCVLHSCDNPPCVNPSHLFLGTKADNATDRDRKDRLITPYIIGHNKSPMKFSEDTQDKIRIDRESGKSLKCLRESYDISRSQLWRILSASSK